jgi:hypothetical protein
MEYEISRYEISSKCTEISFKKLDPFTCITRIFDPTDSRGDVLSSVADRPKFQPQNTKVAPEKSLRPRKSAAEFSAELPKNGRKEAELLNNIK